MARLQQQAAEVAFAVQAADRFRFTVGLGGSHTRFPFASQQSRLLSAVRVHSRPVQQGGDDAGALSSAARRRLAGDDAAPVGKLQITDGEPAGLQQLLARFVNRGRIVIQRADDRQAVGALSQHRQRLAEPEAGNGGFNRFERTTDRRRGVGLGIEGLQLAGSAGHHDQDGPAMGKRGGGPEERRL